MLAMLFRQTHQKLPENCSYRHLNTTGNQNQLSALSKKGKQNNNEKEFSVC